MSSWKKSYRSFYYLNAEDPEDFNLKVDETALLVIDIQNTYLTPSEDPTERKRWKPFFDRMRKVVIPNTANVVDWARKNGIEVIYARIACLKKNGRDRSLSQKKPGFNYLLLPKDNQESQIVPELSPQQDEITILKTTDSALTGTNLRIILTNMGIKNVVTAGIFTDQCISSTVRSLADESFNVIVLDDCCAAATDELHNHELEVINMIYCHVMKSTDIKTLLI